jgi:hypothetical protein
MDDKLIDAWNDLQTQIDVLTAERDSIAEKILPNMQVGDTIASAKGNKIRKCDRGQVVPDLLKAKVSPAMWRKITQAVPVAALYKAELKRGTLAEEVMDACTKRTKPWLRKA